MADNYTFNDVNLETEYGLIVQSVFGPGDFPERKGPVEFSFPDEDGVESFTDEEDIVWEARDIILNCYIKETTEARFQTRLAALRSALTEEGLHDLELKHYYNTYRVFLNTKSILNKIGRWNAVRNVGTFKLVFREPKPIYPAIWKGLAAHWILDDDNEVLGTEMITDQVDRDFSGASHWEDVDLASYNETDDLSITSDGADQYCKLPNANITDFTANKTYKLTVTASSLSGDDFKVTFGTTSQTVGTLADGANIFYFAFDTGGTDLEIKASGTGGITLDNFSIKPVTFDEEVGSTNATPYNFDAESYVADRQGTAEGALDFDGVDDYVDTEQTFESTFQDSFSISLWCKPDDGQPASDEYLIGILNGNDGQMRITIQTTGKIFFYYRTSSGAVQTRTNSAVFDNGA